VWERIENVHVHDIEFLMHIYISYWCYSKVTLVQIVQYGMMFSRGTYVIGCWRKKKKKKQHDYSVDDDDDGHAKMSGWQVRGHVEYDKLMVHLASNV